MAPDDPRMISRLFSLAGTHLPLNRKCCVRRRQFVFWWGVFFPEEEVEKTRVAHLCTNCNFLYVLPAEYGSCLSTDRNSFLSYLARIHCSRRSLHAEHRAVYLLHACSNHWDAHTNLTWIICPFVTLLLRCAFAATFTAPLCLRLRKFIDVTDVTQKESAKCKPIRLRAIDISSGFRQSPGKRPFPPRSLFALLCAGRRTCGFQSQLDCAVFYNH